MCDKAVRRHAWQLEDVPNYFKTQEMSNKTMCKVPAVFFLVPDRFKTQEMCIESLEVGSWLLNDVPDHFKTQEMCDKAVRDDSSYLRYVPDCFVTRDGVYMWYDNSDYYDDDEDNFFKWYNAFQKLETQKASIKEELLPIAWHPSRWWDWCMSEEEKKKVRKIVFDHLTC